MSQEFLHRAYIVMGLQQMRGEGVAQGMATDLFGQARLKGCLLDRPLKAAFVYVMPADLSTPRVRGQGCRGEHILPTPFFSRRGVLSSQGRPDIYSCYTGTLILLKQIVYLGQVLRQWLLPILESSVCGLSAKIRSQVLCRVLFQEETLGRFDETLCPFDTPVGLSIAKALRSQRVSVTAPKYICSILVRLILHGRSPPSLTGQETMVVL